MENLRLNCQSQSMGESYCLAGGAWRALRNAFSKRIDSGVALAAVSRKLAAPLAVIGYGGVPMLSRGPVGGRKNHFWLVRRQWRRLEGFWTHTGGVPSSQRR